MQEDDAEHHCWLRSFVVEGIFLPKVIAVGMDLISCEPQLLLGYINPCGSQGQLCWTVLMRANKLERAVCSRPFCSGPPDFFT